MSKLQDLFVAKDKKNIFNFEIVPSIGYPSGLLPLDYSNGYWVRVSNDGKKNVPDRWLNIGTQGGTFYTIIGNSGVGKSALAIRLGSAMIKGFDNSDYYHIDAEGTSNLTRIQTLNGFSSEEMTDKYHMPNVIYVEDVFTMIYQLAQIKINDKEFSYDTGYFDMTGNPIVIPQPTVVLIDSLPSLQTKDVEDSAELGSQTYNMRLAIAYNTFYKRLRPIIRDANITVFAINHIKEKPQMGFIKTQAKIQYLKPDENIPGGSGPIYYSQNLLRLIYRGRCVKDKVGFDGFITEAVNIKSKTNRSGTSVHLVFHADRGFDPVLSMLKFADDHDLLKGRNPYVYLPSNPDLKFSSKNVDELIANPAIMEALCDSCKPYLQEMIGTMASDANTLMDPKELLHRINASYADNQDEPTPIEEIAKATNTGTILLPWKEKKLFEGIHRYGSKHNKYKKPAIEKILKDPDMAVRFHEYCMNEMHGLV